MMGFVQDFLMAMVFRWLASLTASFGSASGLMLIVVVIAAVYLGRKLAEQLARSLGIGMKPLLVIVILIATLIGLKSMPPRPPVSPLPGRAWSRVGDATRQPARPVRPLFNGQQ